MEQERYDSRPDTLEHIRRVQSLLAEVESNLRQRAIVHDKTKLASPEVEVFDVETPNIKGLTYGSDEYKAALKRLGKGLDHHYFHNRHHPEYWATDEMGYFYKEHLDNGNAISMMTLLDLIEMLVDWKAATERHDNGDIKKSIDQNAERFGYGDQLKKIFHATARELGWYDVPETKEQRTHRLKAEILYGIDLR